MTTSESRGSSTVMSLRLCSRAPLTTSFATSRSLRGRTDVPLAPEEDARGIYGDIPTQVAEAALQFAGIVRDLDDVVLAAAGRPEHGDRPRQSSPPAATIAWSKYSGASAR